MHRYIDMISHTRQKVNTSSLLERTAVTSINSLSPISYDVSTAAYVPTAARLDATMAGEEQLRYGGKSDIITVLVRCRRAF